MKEIAHFAHGNGFPATCYKQLLQSLSVRYNCYYIDRIGHNPDFPITDNWDSLVAEIIANIECISTKPIVGIGHSLGGVLTFLAAIQAPWLFKVVVMIDSPLLSRFKSKLIRLAKVIGFIDKVTPAHRVKARREHWKTREELQAYLAARPFFDTFSPACLQDYIDHGFFRTEKGYTLRFDRTIEYSIFRTLPHHLHYLEGQLRVPTALIYGDQSDIVSTADVRYLKNKYHVKPFIMKGTHMLPMEHPEMLAKTICTVVDILQGE